MDLARKKGNIVLDDLHYQASKFIYYMLERESDIELRVVRSHKDDHWRVDSEDMAAAIDASALVVYRAAWAKDTGGGRATREASIAKMTATESAQKVIDDAVQIFGGLGVVSGHPVEELYRDIRPLRIYEGTTEIQKIIIAREVMKQTEADS